MDGEAVGDDSLQAKAAYFRGVAETLRGIASRLDFEPRRKSQLLALADGFERFALRFDNPAADQPEND